MTGAVVLAGSLQERVGERIREQIGDLLTDADLKVLIDRAVNEAFFTSSRKVNSYGPDTVTPPYIVTLVQDELKAKAAAAMEAWLKEHSDQVQKALDETIAKGMVGLVLGWFEGKVQTDLFNFGQQLQQRFNLR